MGTTTPPAVAIPKSAYVHSGRVWHRIATRSPLSMPSSIRPRPISETISPTSEYETSRHSSPALYLTAVPSPYFSAASSIMSAIVFDPVPTCCAGAAVLASILHSLSSGSRECEVYV